MVGPLLNAGMGAPAMVVAAASCGASAGVAAGAVARRLLARMRRGARVRAPVCEIAVGGLWAGLAGAAGAGLLGPRWLPALLGLAWLAVVASIVDVRHRRLPDALTLPALPAALALVVPLGGTALVGAGGGAALAVAAHALVHVIAPRAMGAGDVKLAGPVGAVVGAASVPAVLVAVVGAAVLSAAAGAVLAGRCGEPDGGRGSVGSSVGSRARGPVAVPHGPSMLAAALLVTVAAAAGSATAGPGATGWG